MRYFTRLTLAFGLIASFMLVTATSAAPRTTVGTLLSGLINVNVSDIEVNIGDITVADLVDVENVLNNNQIDILNNAINNNQIASNNQDFLNNLLRDADILTDNQVVVGVLSGGQFVIQNLAP